MKIYTKSGDGGITGLADGSRVGKHSLRVAAYGDVDELNAALGLAKAHSEDGELNVLLREIQRDLFAIGAQLADPKARVTAKKAKAAVTASHVERLEKAIDRCEAELPALTAFLLPGGSRLGAFLHLARTVCRRAERGVVALARKHKLDPLVIVYLNRLSDLLFVLARHENQAAGHPEDRW
jgi:cob(I)alamin adenosyltransferase